MIVDDICEKWPRVYQWAKDTHIFRLPFEVLEYKGSIGLTSPPQGLIPHKKDDEEALDATWARPVHKSMVLVGSGSERGFLLVTTNMRSDDVDSIKKFDDPDGRGECLGQIYVTEILYGQLTTGKTVLHVRPTTFLQFKQVLAVPSFFLLFADRLQKYGVKTAYDNQMFPATFPRGIDGETLYTDSLFEYVRVQLSMWSWLEGGTREITKEQIVNYIAMVGEKNIIQEALEAGGAYGQIYVTAMTLLNCRNIRVESVIPPPALQKARMRRGKYPLYTYHTLKVSPWIVRDNYRKQEHMNVDVAIHWVRGHFKKYTEENKLFGKHIGVFWWQPQVVGNAPRIVDKEYDASELKFAHA